MSSLKFYQHTLIFFLLVALTGALLLRFFFTPGRDLPPAGEILIEGGSP